MKTNPAILSIAAVAIGLLALMPSASANPHQKRMHSHHSASPDRFTEMRKRSIKTHQQTPRAKAVKTPQPSVCSLFKRVQKKTDGKATRRLRAYGLRKRGGPAFGRRR